ncbi:hypothetical protein, partial [uncultured Rikenella sp.]|uniref:hypothetical protein n=1 Tax=uncultured Rikenella sp. TaxID=368003 RepID=UPI0025E97F88
KARPTARPSAARKPITVFAPEERARPKARPSSPPHVRLTAAPLSLRHIPVTRWDFISILLSQNERNPFLGGRATDFVHNSFFARLGKSCQNAQAHFDDFPI